MLYLSANFQDKIVANLLNHPSPDEGVVETITFWLTFFPVAPRERFSSVRFYDNGTLYLTISNNFDSETYPRTVKTIDEILPKILSSYLVAKELRGE